MRAKIAKITLSAWIALNIGMVIGAVGKSGSCYTVGWGHVLSLAFIMGPTAVLAFFAGRKDE